MIVKSPEIHQIPLRTPQSRPATTMFYTNFYLMPILEMKPSILTKTFQCLWINSAEFCLNLMPDTILFSLSVSLSTTLVQSETSDQILDGYPSNLVITFMFSANINSTFLHVWYFGLWLVTCKTSDIFISLRSTVAVFKTNQYMLAS